MRNLGFLLLLASSLIWAQAAQPPSQPPTEISADLGNCTVDFHVTDLAGNPLYNAKIHTLIRYGFLSKRRLELDTGTNSDGKARFVRMPDQIKKPIVFDIQYEGQKATQNYDPSTNCHARYDVPLRVKTNNAK